MNVYGIIYKIENLVNGKVYIGQTTRKKGFDGRYLKKDIPIEGVKLYHTKLKENNSSYNKHLLSSIEKYGVDNFRVNKILDVAFSKEELDIKEKIWIKIYNSTSPKNGYNSQSGGSNGKPNQDTLFKMSGKNHHSYGKKMNNAVKNKISESKNGKYTYSDNPNSKEIICLNNGVVYKTIKESMEKLGMKTQSGISNVLNGKRKSYRGKYFMYAYDFNNLNISKKEEILSKYKNKNIINKGFKVKCVEDGTCFNSLRDASKYYNTDHTVISRHIKNNTAFKGKHFIKFEDEE